MLDLTRAISFCYPFFMDEKVEAGEPKFVKQMTLAEFDRLFPDEDSCKRYLMEHRWPDGVRCPRCNNEKIYKAKRPWAWECHKCGPHSYRFSLIAGTIFENTNYPLLVWFKVLYLMLTSKKGISALQVHRMIGSGSYRTAWFMCHRLRAAMHDPDFQQLMGIVEVDETYMGGKDKNRHWDKKSGKRGLGSDKTPVIGAISRKGNVVCQMIEHADARTLNSFVRKAVSDKVDLVATDDNPGYGYLGASGHKHESVTHSVGEYVRGEVHTANIDNFWSLLKRGVIGTYHHVSKKYLPLYLAEFQFRFNNRKNADIFGSAVRGC
jgi:transposase-like protein